MSALLGLHLQDFLFITMLKYRERLSAHFLSFVISFTDTCSILGSASYLGIHSHFKLKLIKKWHG